MSLDDLNPAPPSSTILVAAEGVVEIVPLANGWIRITLKPTSETLFIPIRSCETSLPVDVIESFLGNGFAWLCDSLARHDDNGYVIGVIRRQLLAYFDASDFRGKRLLDFGCGTGASSFCMATLLPETEIVGVELSQSHVEMAHKVLSARNLSNIEFLASPDGDSLPAGIGTFDFVMLSAVYEHLLPQERRTVLPLVWSKMKPGAVLFVNQTPYRYFPYEHHSTGLWLINYLPDRVSHWAARKFARHNWSANQSMDWSDHLRGGLRGGTEGQILDNLRLARSGKPTVIQPKDNDRAAYWLSCTNPDRYQTAKKLTSAFFRMTDRFLGTVPSMNLDVAIRKD